LGRRVNSSLSAAGSKVTELAKISFVQIPAESISQEALEGLVEEFVTRNGTDYGDREYLLEEKKDAVIMQINRGDVVIVFDPESETCNIILKEELTRSD
jgi:uncharacterized protein